MQLSTHRLAIAFGGSLLITLGVLAACSTDNGTTPLPGTGTGTDSGKTKTDGSSTGDDTETDGSTPPSDAGTGADCSSVPKLRSNDQGGYFCAFYTRDAAAGDAAAIGGNRNCGDDEICCNPGKNGSGDFPPSYCAKKTGNCQSGAAAAGSTWIPSGGSYWECADKEACGGHACCMFTWADAGVGDKVNLGPLSSASVPKACGALMAYKAGGSRCSTDDTCNADEIKLCSINDDNCTGNQKCTPFSGDFRDLGACK